MANTVVWREHLVCTTKGSNKFYEVTVEHDGSVYQVLSKYGRRGRDEASPRMQQKGRFSSRQSAERKAEQVVRDKKAKGYKKSASGASSLDKPDKKKKAAQTTREVSLDRFALLD